MLVAVDFAAPWIFLVSCMVGEGTTTANELGARSRRGRGIVAISAGVGCVRDGSGEHASAAKARGLAAYSPTRCKRGTP